MEVKNETNNEKLNFLQRVVKNVKSGIRVLRRGGLPLFLQLLYIKFGFSKNEKFVQDKIYQRWIKKNEKDVYCISKLTYNPLISVVVPVYNVEKNMLEDCIESITKQTYFNWELCMADDMSTWSCVREVLDRYASHPQVKIIYREENGHISQASNSAIELATGEFLAFLDCDDILAPNALYEVVKKLNENPNYDFIYSDEDKIDEEGKRRFFPHFKGEWSPDTLMSMMYTSHLGVYRKSLVEEVGGLRVGFEGAQDYDLTLRITEKTNEIGHIPKILYHWRERKESTSANAMAKPYVLEAQKKAKEEALVRRGVIGQVTFDENTVQYQVNYGMKTQPKISIVIPSKDNYKVYARCVKSIYDKSTYNNYEIVTVDNGSNSENRALYENLCNKYGIIYKYEKKDFNFSWMCNQGARYSTGKILLFLNDDTEVITIDWLERLAGQAMLSHSGAVGAKLYYPNSKKIQHCGVVNIVEGPSHIYCRHDDEHVFPFGRNRLNNNFIAVTGACMMVERSKFEQIQCFDEDLPVAYNDIDLCFKLLEKGYYNIQRNDVLLYHYESLSRGDDKMDKEKFKRLNHDREKLYQRHPQFKDYDPYYSYHNRAVSRDL